MRGVSRGQGARTRHEMMLAIERIYKKERNRLRSCWSSFGSKRFPVLVSFWMGWDERVMSHDNKDGDG